MDRQRAEAHLQNFRDSAGNHLGIQPFKGQKQDAEAGGVGHLDVLIVDVLGLLPQHRLQCLAHGGRRGSVAALQSRLQVGVGVTGELGVDGQPDVAVLPRHLDGKLYAVGAAGHSGHVLGILAGGQNLFQDRAQLYLAQNAAGLYAGKHLLQAAHIGGEVLHLAQALVDLLQLGADGAERLVDALLQGVLQFFLDRAADLVQLLVVVGPDGVQPLHQRPAHAVQAGSVGVLKVLQAGLHHRKLGNQRIVGGLLAGGPGAVDGLQPGGAGGGVLALVLGQHGGKVPQRGGGGAGALALHRPQLFSQQVGLALQYRGHRIDNVIGGRPLGLLRAAAAHQ